jgi:hypothetical protein
VAVDGADSFPRPLVDREERIFQVWAYTVSHGQLLLRSTKTETFPTRVEVLFKDVKALQLPTLLDGLVVTEADAESAQRIEAHTGLTGREGAIVYGIRTSRGVGHVVAGALFTDEDFGEHFEPSSLWPNTP